MAITTPKFYELQSFQCDFPELRDQIFPYAIGFTKNDGLWWSVVFSYLFPVKGLTNFKTRVANLHGDENKSGKVPVAGASRQQDIENLYKFLKKYNPFRNRYSCFYNDTLKDLVRKFEKNMFRHVTDENMEAVSRVLKIDIALCDVTTREVKLFRFRSEQAISECSLLTLYTRSEEDNPSNKFFCFGIARNFGMQLQSKALRSIFLAANVYPKVAKGISRGLSPNNNNIVMILVKQNLYWIISVLFNQPHILFKLEDAGCTVDPAITDDEGNTALYYAIKTKKEHIVHKFYNYLSGAIQLSGISPRKPTESVLINLEHLGEVLKEHILKFGNTESKVFLEQLIKFSRFQFTMVTELLKTETIDDLPSGLSDEGVKVEKKKRKIIAILSTYADYFDFEDILIANHDSVGMPDLEKIVAVDKKFKKYEKYHQILDFNAALLFFDNLFSLKQRLLLENHAYETIESAFFCFILTCSFYSFSKFFPYNSAAKKRKRKIRNANDFLIPKARCYRIIYMERLKLRKSLETFKDVLDNTHVKEESIVKGVPESVIETVTSLPKIRDVIIVRTVLHYLDVISKIESKDDYPADGTEIPEVLAIERALQVVGECLNERTAGSISLGKSLLVSALPVSVRMNLRDIRDHLSHTDDKRVVCRERIKGCKENFGGIKTELRTIKSQIEQTHRLLELLASEYVFLEGLQHLKEIQLMLRVYPKGRVALLSKSIREERCLLETVIHTIQNEINSFVHHRNLQIHFSYIDDYMFESQVRSKSDRLAKVLFHLNCVKVLFIHISQEQEVPSIVEELINEIGSLAVSLLGEEKACSKGMRQTVEAKTEFLMKTYDIYAKKRSHKTFKPIRIKSLKSRKWNLYGALARRLQNVHHDGLSHSQQKAVWVEKTEENNNCPSIEKFAKSLSHCYPITEEEKHFIISKIPLKFQVHSEAKNELLRILHDKTNEHSASDVDVDVTEQIQELLPSKNRNDLLKDFSDPHLLKTNIDVLKSFKDYYGDMVQKLGRNEMISGADFNLYCSNLELHSEIKAKELLKKCMKGGSEFRAKNDAILKYLRDKIVILEKLLIKSNPSIDRMWPEVKSSKTKQHIIYRIKERYVRDSRIQAAVEMLLFDCMNILKHRKDLERLWIKASSLFNGINLRNILAHGNPLFGEVGRILDPDDFPSEIIAKCLELVDDRSAIEAMCELLEKTGGTREDFVAAVKARKEDCVGLCDAITRVAKWESYASVIPSSSRVENNPSEPRKRHASGKRHPVPDSSSSSSLENTPSEPRKRHA